MATAAVEAEDQCGQHGRGGQSPNPVTVARPRMAAGKAGKKAHRLPWPLLVQVVRVPVLGDGDVPAAVPDGPDVRTG